MVSGYSLFAAVTLYHSKEKNGTLLNVKNFLPAEQQKNLCNRTDSQGLWLKREKM